MKRQTKQTSFAVGRDITSHIQKPCAISLTRVAVNDFDIAAFLDRVDTFLEFPRKQVVIQLVFWRQCVTLDLFELFERSLIGSVTLFDRIE